MGFGCFWSNEVATSFCWLWLGFNQHTELTIYHYLTAFHNACSLVMAEEICDVWCFSFSDLWGTYLVSSIQQ